MAGTLLVSQTRTCPVSSKVRTPFSERAEVGRVFVWSFVTVIAFNFLGDGLQDSLDPRAVT
jgi:hypothetical protein